MLSAAPGAIETLLVRAYVQWPALEVSDQPAPGMMSASLHALLLDGRSKLTVGAVQVTVPVFWKASEPW